MESRLNVLVDVQTFWFTPPPGEPLDLDRFFGQTRSAVEALLQQRWVAVWVEDPPPAASVRSATPCCCTRPACRWPLSPVLQQRIATHQKHNSQAGFLCQMCFGLCLPSGLLTGTGAWDYGARALGMPRCCRCAAV